MPFARRWPGLFNRALQLLEADPLLGGVIAVGFRPELSDGRRIGPHAALTGYQTPWGYQPGVLDGSGRFTADLDLLSPEAQGVLAQRMDAGGCTLVAWCHKAPWAHLADRVAFLVTDRPWAQPPRGRSLSRGEAMEAIALAALQLQVEGHRAEWFALRAAEAGARLAGRKRLCEGDVAEAVSLVLAPRAKAAPEQPSEPQSRPQESRQRPDEQAEAPVLPVPLPPLPEKRVELRPSLYGAPVRSVPGRRRRGTLDLTATLLAALPWQKLRGSVNLPPLIQPGDLRWHLRRPRQGRLIIFAVDGSGSMGARRLGQSKGAVLRLLAEAYRERDQVALVAAAGKEARLLLPPARAVEQARHKLVALPAGGATPLAGALLIARDLAVRARQRENRSTLLLLLTDGRANQPLPGGSRSTVRDELRRSSLAVRAAGVDAVVLGEPGQEGAELARWLGGRFQLIGRGIKAAPK